ncbi:MAG: hypothetical protein ACOX3T_06355 [Bdellovibrionota bacterium]
MTNVDKSSDRNISDKIKKDFPNTAILSEESAPEIRDELFAEMFL